MGNIIEKIKRTVKIFLGPDIDSSDDNFAEMALNFIGPKGSDLLVAGEKIANEGAPNPAELYKVRHTTNKYKLGEEDTKKNYENGTGKIPISKQQINHEEPEIGK